jgi:hypothetical protein
MAESETRRVLHNGSLTSKAIGVVPEGPPSAGKALPTPASGAPHGCTLQFLISIIKQSRQRNPS